MSSAFASRCLQGKFWQLICEALNKRAVTGARLPFQRFLVFPHLRGDLGDSAGERCCASGLFVNASRQVSRMLPSCLKHVLGLCCLKEKVKIPQLLPPGVLQTMHPHCTNQQASLSL